MSFANNLKNIRVASNINQQDLAIKLNTTVKTISHWETGYSEPSISQLVELSKIFDISIDELVKDN